MVCSCYLVVDDLTGFVTTVATVVDGGRVRPVPGSSGTPGTRSRSRSTVYRPVSHTVLIIDVVAVAHL